MKKIIPFLLVFVSVVQIHAQPFITTWRTDNPGESADNQIIIPTTGSGYDYNVFWEEVGNTGNNGTLTNITGNVTIDFPTPGTYQVEISGLFPRIFFNGAGFFGDDTDFEKILTIEQWGNIAWISMVSAFSGCENLRINASDAPDLSAVTDMSNMFEDASALNDDISSWDVSNVTTMFGVFDDAVSFNQPLNNWNVSNVTDMSEMFFFASSFNQPLDSWNVSNVTNMSSMFGGATAFNQNIGGWDVSSVTNMSGMLSFAIGFNQDITGWNVSNVTNMTSLFNGVAAFNQDISGWNVDRVKRMINMFSGASSFNQNISIWNVDSVTDMRGMFDGASSFNQDISSWDVSMANDMDDMFSMATSFNQDISGWDVSGVGSMNSMFEGASSFNQDISIWNVTNVDDMRSMFSGAAAFDQNLGGWDVSNVRFMFNMFNNSGLSVANYDNALIGWAVLPTLRNNVQLTATNVFFCAGETARDFLITNFNWFITDGGQGCIATFDGVDVTGTEIFNSQTEAIDFGSTSIGSPKPRDFTILNRLAGNLTNVNISVSGTTFNVGTFPTTIGNGMTATIAINLNGTGIGTFTETVSITSDDFTGTFEFPVTGEITATPEPEIVVFQGSNTTGNEITNNQASPFDLGNELRGTSILRDITISNIGSQVLNISDITITGTEFMLGSIPPSLVPVGDTETFQVIILGNTAGSFTETLTIMNDDTDEAMFSFDLFADITGPDIAVFDGTELFVDPEIFDGQTMSLDFGSFPQGTDILRPITITNFNGVDLLVSDITISSGAFSVDIIPPFTVTREIDGMLSTVTFNLILSGAVPGSFSGTVTVVNDDDDEPTFEFPIEGDITGATSPEITVFDGPNSTFDEILDGVASPVDFGSQVQGSGINRTFSISNQGSAPLIISNIMIGGSGFIINSAISFPLTINSGGSELLDIFLMGSTPNVFTETVTIESNDTDESIFDFQITGTITASPEPEIALFLGPDISGIPIIDGQTNSVSFGNTTEGINITQQITIENQGTAELDLNIYSFDPPGTFFITSTPPSTIAPGLSETIDIEFDASTIGTFTATFEIDNSDLDEGIFNFPITATVAPPPNMPPSISSISDVSIDEDTSTGTISFSINDAETPASDLTVIANSGNPSLIPSSEIILSGSNMDRSISATPITNANGITTITIEVSDGEDTSSESFQLTVNAVNDAPLITDQLPLSTRESTPITITLTDYSVEDPDNNFPTGFQLNVIPGTDFTVDGNTITPSDGFIGDLMVSVTVNDGVDDSPIFTTLIEVLPTEPELYFGESTSSGVEITNNQPDGIDLGETPIRTEKAEVFTINNTGSSDLIINSITITDPNFGIEDAPQVVLSGQALNFRVVLLAVEVGSFTGIVNIESSAGAFEFPVFGEVTTLEIQVINAVAPFGTPGANDFFEIRNLPENSLVTIYNRWGDRVFEMENYSGVGDNLTRTFNGQKNINGTESLTSGTYYYEIRVSTGEQLTGFLVLRR
ncbi:MAG: BspA family leucine-rich repeat surface protein [Bacteroidota bacterium]